MNYTLRNKRRTFAPRAECERKLLGIKIDKIPLHLLHRPQTFHRHQLTHHDKLIVQREKTSTKPALCVTDVTNRVITKRTAPKHRKHRRVNLSQHLTDLHTYKLEDNDNLKDNSREIPMVNPKLQTKRINDSTDSLNTLKVLAANTMAREDTPSNRVVILKRGNILPYPFPCPLYNRYLQVIHSHKLSGKNRSTPLKRFQSSIAPTNELWSSRNKNAVPVKQLKLQIRCMTRYLNIPHCRHM